MKLSRQGRDKFFTNKANVFVDTAGRERSYETTRGSARREFSSLDSNNRVVVRSCYIITQDALPDEMLPLPRMSGSGFCSHPKLENVGTSVLWLLRSS